MSADNYIAVIELEGGAGFAVCHGFMSVLIENADYRGDTLSVHETRAEALVAAHDAAARETVLEYGVIELGLTHLRQETNPEHD